MSGLAQDDLGPACGMSEDLQSLAASIRSFDEQLALARSEVYLLSARLLRLFRCGGSVAPVTAIAHSALVFMGVRLDSPRR